MPEGVMDKLRTAMLGLPRRHKRAIQVTTDVILVWIALWLAFVVRLGIEVLATPIETHLWLFTAAPLIAIPIFIRFGMYRAVMRYFGNDALITIGKAVSLSALLLALVVYWYSNHEAVVPRSIIFNYWWLSLIMIGGLRLMMRQYFLGDWFAASQHVPFTNRDDGLPKVAIYGAGVAGNQLVAALRMGRVMRPVAFIDDDSSLADRMIAGGLATRWPRPPSPRKPDNYGNSAACEMASLTEHGDRPFTDIAIAGGHIYIEVMRSFLAAFRDRSYLAPHASVTEINAPIGIMRQQLGSWLAGPTGRRQ